MPHHALELNETLGQEALGELLNFLHRSDGQPHPDARLLILRIARLRPQHVIADLQIAFSNCTREDVAYLLGAAFAGNELWDYWFARAFVQSRRGV